MIISGNVDFVLALLVIGGGVLGGYVGIKTSKKIPKENLVKVFSILLFAVASYIMIRTVLL